MNNSSTGHFAVTTRSNAQKHFQGQVAPSHDCGRHGIPLLLGDLHPVSHIGFQLLRLPHRSVVSDAASRIVSSTLNFYSPQRRHCPGDRCYAFLLCSHVTKPKSTTVRNRVLIQRDGFTSSCSAESL